MSIDPVRVVLCSVTATAAVLGWCALFAWHLVGRGKPMRVTPLMRFLRR
ncbi:MAG: hypothetical protein H6726_31875 [Sandaracinaceae bacterium]|nr:hypothetical protein [Myxococcales bacterium]MCB9662284.1 hypothetical protein [Sandaracinaceae bacterium]